MKRSVLGLTFLLAGIMVLVVACGGKKADAPAAPVASACTDSIGCYELAKGESLKIGYALVIAGENASLGIDSRRGIEIAMEDKGGKLLDRTIQLIGEDTGCSAEGGQAAALKLAADAKLVAVVGTSCSSEARAGAPTLIKAGKVMVSPSNTAVVLTAADRGPDFAGYLRTAHNDAIQGAVVARFAYNELKVKKAATIHDGSPYSEGLQRVFAEEFKKLGGTITNQEAISEKDTDMRPVLTRIGANKPEMIYFPVFVAAGGHIARQSREVEGVKTTMLVASDGTFSEDFVKAAGTAAAGIYLSSPDQSAFTAGYAGFKDKHKKKYGEDPLSAFHAHAYDAAHIIFNAIEKVAKTDAAGKTVIGKQALRDALFATKDHKGLTGNITCNKNGDCADPIIAMYKLDGKTWPPKVHWAPAR